MKDEDILGAGRRVLRMGRDALGEAEGRLDGAFVRAVRLIANSPGRVIVAGMGKSGIVARKIAGTLTSTGRPATFLHPVESLHGDLGLVGNKDVAILLSKSGDSSEMLVLLEQLQGMGVRTIAITGAPTSPLARHADISLDGSIREEACPHDLAPTTSTTLAQALGDALAVALLEEKGFGREDFARLHPGGALGRRLLTRVTDVMLTEDLPFMSAHDTMREATKHLASRRGIAVVVDAERRLCGVVTAGDLHRLLEHGEDGFFPTPVATVMTQTPKIAAPEELASAVIYRMQTLGIIVMPVLDDARAVVGVVHLHDLMRAVAG